MIRLTPFLVMILCTLSLTVTAQNSQYLPVDSDEDGVLDELDECYKTPKGTPVDQVGCKLELREYLTFNLNIQFAFDSYQIEPGYHSELERVAVFLKQYPLALAMIEGHADSDGSHRYNKSLSQRRAEVVARRLVDDFNISHLRVTAKGYGEEKPLVVNDTDEKKHKNRRVVAVIKVLKQ